MKTPRNQTEDQVLDEWLVLQLQSGDERALQLLFKRWNKKLIRQANWYTRDLQAAQDIVQEVWMVIVKDIHKLKDTSKYASWALTITTRKAIDWVRRQKMQAIAKKKMDWDPIEANDIEDETEEKIKAMRKAMDLLDVDQQSILSLYYSEGQSINTIAKILKIPAGTVKSRLFHARQKLKRKLKFKT